MNHFLKSQHARTIFQYLSTFEPSPNTCTQVCLAHIMHNTHMRHHVHHACGQTYATWQRVIRGYSTVSIIAGLPLLVLHLCAYCCVCELCCGLTAAAVAAATLPRLRLHHCVCFCRSCPFCSWVVAACSGSSGSSGIACGIVVVGGCVSLF